MPSHDTVCFISARNLGDAVLHADFLKQLMRGSYARRLVVWTFPQAAFLFDSLSNCEIVISNFPIGTTARNFIRGGFNGFVSASRYIKSLKPDLTLDIVGDFRERLALRLLNAPIRLSPEWETGHPFRRHNRMPPYRPGQLLSIPASEPNIYDAHRRMLRALVPGLRAETDPSQTIRIRGGRTYRIGLHPFASAAFKLWPQSNWIQLIELLSQHLPGSSFILFGAPADRPTLETLGSSVHAPHILVTGPLPEFREHVASIDLLVGLDSFSVHMAHSSGIPSVMLVGANDPRIFAPPSTRTVFSTGSCNFQPCGGRPKCIRTTFEYACMSRIAPFTVLSTILTLFRAERSPSDQGFNPS